MTAAQSGPESVEKTSQPFPWITIACVAALLVACYAPVLYGLGSIWYNDADMGHGFFVPVIAGYIAWQKRSKIEGLAPRPSWWGLPVLLWGGLQLYLGTLGAELYTTRTSVVFSIAGAVLLLGGTKYLRIFWFPIFLLFFMVPIPAVVYNEITFPLQLLASRVAENAISFLGIPIIREGNVLELASQKLDVVEACSGIRSLLTLTFLSLVYGYFCEKRTWLRAVLFFSTIPIAIAANAARVTITGVLANFRPELAEGLFHEAQGWVIFMVAFAILAGLHQLLVRGAKMMEKGHELSPA
ncbi:MAG TPA: exosortase/archaeosortase family protein [Bryobacteraceae bacterium]|nr:exosortase/archaeosortase family protein [Bryobacteraceae bacterium]